MRISTSMMFERGLNAMQNRQSDLSRTGEQIASGKKIVAPSDDPRSASQALIVKQDQAIQSQFESSRTSATSALEAQENALSGVSDLLNRAKGLVVQAGNGTMSDGDRQSVASDLEGIYNGLMSLGNSQDSNGLHIFSGSQGNTQPFVEEVGQDGSMTVSYEGDSEPLEMRVDASRLMNVNASGDEMFRTPATDQDEESSIFNVFQEAIGALRNDDLSAEERRATIDQVNRQLGSGSDNVLQARTSIGTRLNELDVLEDIGASRTISNASTISSLEDLDYAEAISRYTLGQIGLEASQKMFNQVQQTSLFNLIR